MKVLVACEYSGRVRRAFRDLGHDAWSCDLLPSADDSPHHIQGDALGLLDAGWDLMIAHPPCTYLALSGVRWLHTRPERWAKLNAGAAFFRALWNAPIPRVCIENPIPHRYAQDKIGARYAQKIQPYHFGHLESKATCLWLRGLPLLEAATNYKAQTLARPKKDAHRTHYASPGPNRWKIRSETYEGIARAMANQWGADYAPPASIPGDGFDNRRQFAQTRFRFGS